MKIKIKSFLKSLVFLFSMNLLNLPVQAISHSSGNQPSKKSELMNIEKNVPFLKFQVIRSKKIRTKDNTQIYYLEDRELPIVTVRLIVKRGTFLDQIGKEGLSSMFSKVWRQSGSKNFSGKDLNSYFEFIGGSLEVNFGTQYGSVTLNVLKKYLAESLPKFEDFILNPKFSPDKFNLIKGLKLDKLHRTMDSPFALAFRYFRQKAMPNSNYAKIESKKSLHSIQIEDLQKFYDETFHKKNIAWIITGDLSETEAVKIANSLALPKVGKMVQKKFPLEENRKGKQRKDKIKIFIINRALPQSTIVLGGSSISHNHPDRMKLIVTNFILGRGGFNSHLMQEIRSNRGLAYSVGSLVRDYRDFGIFLAYAQTKNSSVKTVIQLIHQEMQKLGDKQIPERELHWAKNSLINQFVFLFQSTSKIALREFELDLDNLPEDYLEKFTDQLKSISKSDIQKISQKILRPKNFPVIVVGPAKLLQASLAKIGEVIIIEPEI